MTEIIEQWKTIEDYPDYKISSHGRVKSLKKGSEKILKPVVNHGYEKISLYRKSGGGVFCVHILVLEYFVSKRIGKYQACHNNGNPLDNKLRNLRWDTQSNNQLDRIIHGTSNRGERSGSSKLKEVDVIYIRSEIKNKRPLKSLAEQFNVSACTISAIKTKRKWGWLKQEVLK